MRFAPAGRVNIDFVNASTGVDLIDETFTPTFFQFDQGSKIAFMTAGGVDISTAENGRTTVTLEGTSYSGKDHEGSTVLGLEGQEARGAWICSPLPFCT